MKLGIIMDPIGKINIEKDSSFAMLLAAQKCGWDLLYMELSDLYMDNDTPIARMRNLEVNNDSKSGVRYLIIQSKICVLLILF